MAQTQSIVKLPTGYQLHLHAEDGSVRSMQTLSDDDVRVLISDVLLMTGNPASDLSQAWQAWLSNEGGTR